MATETLAATPRAGTASAFGTAVRTFGSVLWRDVFVTWRELIPFLAQVIVQPFFTLFIFGKVLTGIGYVGGIYTEILPPGIVARRSSSARSAASWPRSSWCRSGS